MKKFVSVVVMMLLVNTICFAQVKTIKKEATEDVPSNKSLDQVVATMTNDMIKQAVEESGIKLKDYELSETELAEFIKTVPQVEVKSKKVSMKKDNQQAVKMKLNIGIDADSAKAYLDKVKQEKEEKAKAKEEKAKAIEEKVQETITNTTPKTISVKTETRVSIQKALEDSKKMKKEVAKFYDNFDNTLKEDNEEISKDYDGKISKINLNIKKDQWETTEQYNKKIEEQKLEKQKLEQEKQKAISENNIKIAQLAITTTQSQIDKLKSFQSDNFYDEDDSKAQIVSLGKVDADEKYFIIKILYENEQSIISNLIYDFSDMDIEQAKAMYQTPKQFVIEPLFSVSEGKDGNVERVLTAFTVKHLDTLKEKIVKISSTEMKQFSELKKFEVYENIVNKKEEPIAKEEIKKQEIKENVDKAKEEVEEVKEQVNDEKKEVKDKIKEEAKEQKEIAKEEAKKVKEEMKEAKKQANDEEKEVKDKIKEEAKEQKEIAKEEVKKAKEEMKEEIKDKKESLKEQAKTEKEKVKEQTKELKEKVKK